MEKPTDYCGIDISKDTLDVCYLNEDAKPVHLQIKNDSKGFKELLKQCKGFHFVMENTGVYHMKLLFFLHKKQEVFSVVNALKIKRYIQMHLDRDKTDKKDAKRIMEYGIDHNPGPYNMPEEAYFEVRTINSAIHDLTKEITRFSNQLHTLNQSPQETKEIEKSFRSILKKLRKEKDKLQESLDEKLKQWQPELLKQVSSVKGIGKRAAAELIVYTKAFRGMDNYRQLVSYAGLNPREYSSGSSIRGKSRISKRGGRVLRNILYMCALNAKDTNRACRLLYKRLVAKGKNKKLAIIAVCNKLLKQVFGCVKNRLLYDDNYQSFLA